MVEMRNASSKILESNLTGRDHYVNLSVDGRIILRQI
jgi:hypothetical protein